MHPRHLALATTAALLLAACGPAPVAQQRSTAGSAPVGPVVSDAGPSAPDDADDRPAGSASPDDEPASAPLPRATMRQQPRIVDPAAMPDVQLPAGVVPSRVRIPAIGVDAAVTDLAITADEVEVPEDFDEVGWWTQTRRPGEIGPAVLGGHVDSRTGPAVFFRLAELVPGDEIVVLDDAGEQVVFVVERGLQVDKLQRPPEVFGFGQGRPELRLITCGGEFDPTTGHYTDNYVVFAHQADWQA